MRLLVDSRKFYGDKLDRFARDHIRRHPGTPYEKALQVAMDLNPEWKRGYLGIAEREPQSREVGAVIDRAVKAYCRQHPNVSYGDALRKYLDEHPQMKAAYSGLPVAVFVDEAQ